MGEPFLPYLSFFLGGLVFLALAGLVLRPKFKVILREARISAEEWKAQARRKLDEDRESAETEHRRRSTALEEREAALGVREGNLQKEREKVDQRRKELNGLEEAAAHEQREATKQVRLYRLKLHQLTGLDGEELREQMRRTVEDEAAIELQELRQELLVKGEAEIEDHARQTLLSAMQRIASNPANDSSATLVQLPNEEMKGRIIGREGRNIRSFELETGTTLMIDETPEHVMISSFDPVRREISRLALQKLIKDGRINPTTIEQTVVEVRDNMQRTIVEFGENAIRDLRLKDVHPEVVGLLGKLHYRLSNNQNTLDHSIEVAFICSLLASELGLDTQLAKRAGLFHDMGKSVSHEYEGSHAKVGADILRRHNEHWQVVNAVHAHHEEVPAQSAYAGLVMVADSLSAMRPGARTDSMESYVQRVEDLERIAGSFEGVSEAYAVQAGREIRIIVSPEQVDDLAARQLARKIRQRVEDELSFPNQIRVTVIRERRFSETAK